MPPKMSANSFCFVNYLINRDHKISMSGLQAELFFSIWFFFSEKGHVLSLVGRVVV